MKSKVGEGTLVRISLPPPVAAVSAATDEIKLAG
jgi:hypothetical protein